MIKNYVDLKRNEKFERKIRIACDFHSAKYKFTRGRILNVDKVNVSFIEPHRFLIELNYYNKINNKWLKDIKRKDYLLDLCSRYYEVLTNK